MTPEQIAILRTYVMSEPALADAVATSNDYAIQDWLNGQTTGHYVWKTSIPTQDIFDNITWANFTPQDAPDGTLIWQNRSMACQGKQFNIQTILIGSQGNLNPSKATARAGLQDAMTALPSGAGGANKSGGWNNVVAIMYRLATRAEKVLASGVGTTASPALLTFEGQVTRDEASLMR